MEEMDKVYATLILPYQQSNLENGVKYLTFYLKANDYKKRDWLNLCFNRWLSKGGKLVLVKVVLEALPIY